MNHKQLINKNFLKLQRKKISKDNEKFIYTEISNRINQSLEGLNLSVNKCLEIGISSTHIHKYLLHRFKDLNYSALDIAEDTLSLMPNYVNKYCADNDNWDFNKNEFNLILSNFYLHLTNDLDILFKNINSSLKKDGFFIASIPGHNCLHELKKVLINTDIKMYGGAYNRFNNNFSIQHISKLLKKNNFKTPLLDIDTFVLKYTDFDRLLKDVRNLGNSYTLNNRKKVFEKREYFKMAEKIYWDNFSKDNNLYLTFEIIYFSGWKDQNN